jgi:anthraniloyl-CoA monooxygenase
MKIVCVGAGPAALYFAISAKRRDAGHDITVLERDPEGATYGWGVVYWDNLLDMLYGNDLESARAIRSASRLWQDQEIRLGGSTAYLGGYGYSITRAALLQILIARARALGVQVHHDTVVDDPATLAAADMIVGADGAGSIVRRRHAEAFGTSLARGSNRYIWLGTDTVFNSFVFSFAETPAGWMWFHAYPSSSSTSTCIVECTDPTWRGLGLDQLSPDDGLRTLEKIFSDDLRGGTLVGQSRSDPAPWLRFTQVHNQRFWHENIVLLGDAAHTTHFTIGSGTRLAMIDAVGLAQSVYESTSITTALQTYDRRRRDALRTTQASARTSMAWFENVEYYLDQYREDVIDLAYSMSGRQSHQPPWRLQKHLAMQIRAPRRARRHYDSVRRWYGASRRGEIAVAGPLIRALATDS